jgi:hypothetical protein
MQLVSFRMGWPPPPRGWHVNRRPANPASGTTDDAKDNADIGTPSSARTPSEESAIRRELAIDYELFELARKRFWMAYAAMLNELCPDGTRFGSGSAGDVPLDLVQSWLRARYTRVMSTTFLNAVTEIDVTADDPLCGEGWWWRSGWERLDDRWTGPEPHSTWFLPPLATGHTYDLTIDVLWPASPEIWDNTTIDVNGQRVFITRERCQPDSQRGATHRLRARIPPRVVALQDRYTHVALEIPETAQVLKTFVVCESFDTYHHDERLVGLSVLGLRVRPI